MGRYAFENDMCLPPQTNRSRLRCLRSLPLEPMEYCQRWVKADPAKGYRKVCINALAEATGLSARTIGNWGSGFERRPRHIPYILRQADLLNQIEELEQKGQTALSYDLLQE